MLCFNKVTHLEAIKLSKEVCPSVKRTQTAGVFKSSWLSFSYFLPCYQLTFLAKTNVSVHRIATPIFNISHLTFYGLGKHITKLLRIMCKVIDTGL